RLHAAAARWLDTPSRRRRQRASCRRLVRWLPLRTTLRPCPARLPHRARRYVRRSFNAKHPMSRSADVNSSSAVAGKSLALRLSGIGKTFVTPAGLLKPAYRTVALKDISIDVQPSEILAIVGESGSGKTTLGRIVVGLLKADSGAAYLGDRTLVDVSHGIHVPAAR